jgi:hypothetical protein
MASWCSPISSSRSPRRSSSCSTSTTRTAAAEARREGARRRAAKCEAEEAKRNEEAEAEAEERRAAMCARVAALLTALARARGFSTAVVQQQALAEYEGACARAARVLALLGTRCICSASALEGPCQAHRAVGQAATQRRWQVGAAPRQQFGWAAVQGAVDVAPSAKSSECWPLVALVVQRNKMPRRCDRNGGGAWRAQSRAARDPRTRGRNKNTYVFFI